MSVREWVFAAALVVSAGLVVAGIAAVSGPAALVVAGVLLAGLSWLILGGDVGSDL